MKTSNSLATAAFALLALNAASGPMLADTVDVPWNKVCQTARNQQMRITTSTGETVEGYCISIGVDELTVRTRDNQAVRIAKSALSRIVVPKERQLEALGRGMQRSIQFGLKALPTPYGPLVVPVIPATIAYGAAAAPFCAVGDLLAKRDGLEIRPR